MSEEDLYDLKEHTGEPENMCPDHPLNTDVYKKKMMIQDEVTCFAFYSN
jgi:hypothetical protein